MRTLFPLLLLSLLPLLSSSCSATPVDPEEIVRGSWVHYKRTFITEGRVVRPQNSNDTVSEGEAYAMLRAVLMDDRKTFDECLAWSEATLSRKESHGDDLLAWHFENGRVSDSTAASDADIDYAYSLLLAWRTWQESRYLDLARKVLQSILDKETVLVNNRLYLLPWPAGEGGSTPPDSTPQNPSYYAPSHFRLFYAVTGDKRWMELVDTTYELLGRLQKSNDNPGLVPDWCALDMQENIIPMPGKKRVYGWDAVRVPLRVAADYRLNDDHRALQVLRIFSEFFEREFRENGKIVTGYSGSDATKSSMENPLFYAAAYAATEASDSPIAPEMLQRVRDFIHQNSDEYYYNEANDYYVNSLVWLTEYFQITKKTATND
ncbi:glycosyl hydrolase family 8 [Chlorobium ferrooxidans]|uniref:cellulase n=1 Tax=Chlorobium ferrooxidans DSM 13031 TaxID=377431 RepID=Q0YP21_9CHLB|nr:glycosyl hydrolase family 8 [Chlorobium ferrooxidans]EAT58047.1 Cellulase [Chlorobium ferrooxidans DSM 13031]